MTTARERDGWWLLEEAPDAAGHRVLLVPGFWGSDRIFAKLVEQPVWQEARVHLIAGNPPGFKGSPVPDGFGFGVEEYAQSFESLCDAESIDLVVTHGFSANVGIEMAARGAYGGKLLLISPTLSRVSEAKSVQKLDRHSRGRLMQSVAWSLAYSKLKSRMAPYLDDRELLEAFVEDAHRIEPKIARRVLLGYFDHIDRYGDLAKRLVTTRCPVYFVRGEHDHIGYSQASEAVLKASKRIRIHHVAGARHFAMVDRPEAVAGLALRFLDEAGDE